MTMQRANEPELMELLNALCEDTLTRDAAARLEQLVRGNPAMQDRYLAYLYIDAALRWDRPAGIPQAAGALDSRNDAAVVAPAFPIVESLSASPSNPLHAVHGIAGYFASGWPVAYLIATVLFAIGLTTAAWIHVSRPAHLVHQSPSEPSRVAPQSAAVGRITGMVDCILNNDECRMQNAELRTQKTDVHHSSVIAQHSPIHLGDCLALTSGLLEITYDTGATVILQGPVTYEVESPAGGYLFLGKLTAKLEKRSEVRGQRSESENQKSEILNHQFAVRTPTATITDLGTEFGVEVREDGQTASHVFRGSVRVQGTLPDGTVCGEVRVLSANQSVRVERGAVQGKSDPVIVVGPAVESPAFLRAIPGRSMKVLDLADVVAGGDGFSGRRNRGIDPRNGRLLAVRPPEHPLLGDGAYHRVPELPYVDGVFIPHASDAPVQLDSAGHRFSEFSVSHNTTDGPVYAGREGADSAELDGIDYAGSGHAVVALHANKGITFDLDAVRRANRGWKLVRFQSVAGNAEQHSEKGGNVHADLWVFVDGQVRFKRREFNRFSGPAPVVIPIADTNRFLTLVATDGGDGIGLDWTIFGDPRLELMSVEAGAQPDKEAR